MPTGDDDALRVRSWITPKATKGGASAIDGRGVHAVEAIAGGEVVAVKGGHIVDGPAVAGLPEAIRDSAFPIGPDLFLAALTPGEYEGVMMRVNHSCAPNVGMGGNIVLVAMRDIATGEELTIDYALFLGDPGFSMTCRCGTAACRGVVRGTDWMRTDVRERYRDGFPGGSSTRSHKPGTPGHRSRPARLTYPAGGTPPGKVAARPLGACGRSLGPLWRWHPAAGESSSRLAGSAPP